MDWIVCHIGQTHLAIPFELQKVDLTNSIITYPTGELFIITFDKFKRASERFNSRRNTFKCSIYRNYNGKILAATINIFFLV